MLFKESGLAFGNDLAPNRLASRMDRFTVARDQVMPFRQWQASSTQFISATIWQPFEFLELVPGQPDAVGNMKFAVAIVAALGVLDIEQLARNIRHINLTVILIFGFQQTAFTAAIAQGFPLAAI